VCVRLKEDVVLRIHIDATCYGNESRFINHSCDPNLDLHLVGTLPVMLTTIILSRFGSRKIAQ
jgi:SET domain-containing protein